MAEKPKHKSMIKKAAEAIDHAIHPSHLADTLEQVDRSLNEEPEKALGAHDNKEPAFWEQDLKAHPKFDKFKNQKGSN